MATVTRNDLIRQVTDLLKTRGLRLAGHTSASGGGLNSDSYKVYTHTADSVGTGYTSGRLDAPAGTIYRIVIDLNLAKLTTLDEKVVQNLNSPTGIPNPTRT